jgi:hypothetical protein
LELVGCLVGPENSAIELFNIRRIDAVIDVNIDISVSHRNSGKGRLKSITGAYQSCPLGDVTRDFNLSACFLKVKIRK